MNRIRPAFLILRPVQAAVLALALILIVAPACSRSQPAVTHTSHWAVRTPESLAIDVVGYAWTLDGRRIRIFGQVRNNSDQAHQSVTLVLTLTDERGEVVAKGETAVFPAYLKPGGEGTFDLLSLATSAGRNLPAGRLLTTARTTN